MGSDPRLELVEHFFSGTGLSYDRIVHLFTLGIDDRWKNGVLKKLSEPRRVLDLACGTGILTFLIARRFPTSHVVGVELRQEYLDIAREKAAALGIRNVEFVLSRAEDLQWEGSFDCITSSYLAKYADLKRLVPKLAGLLEPGGSVLFHDFTYPANPVWRAGWELYFKLMQGLGKKIYPEWTNVFYGLPKLLRQTPWARDLPRVLEEYGFSEIRTEYLTLGASALITAIKPGTGATPAG